MVDANQDRRSITALVGDLGGTHARFGLVDLAAARLDYQQVLSLRCADFPGPTQAIASYLAQVNVRHMPEVAVLAVAGPVTHNAVQFTNNSWKCSEEELRATGFRAAKLLNDFETLAYAAGRLQASDLRPLMGPAGGTGGSAGGGRVATLDDGNLIVLGPGTGFGLSLLARNGVSTIAVATEAGHAAFAPNDKLECEVLQLLMRQANRIVVENILSGPGLLRLYRALCTLHDASASAASAADVSLLARGGDVMSCLAIQRFCAILGSVAGDAAMIYGARGGVYVTGGVADNLAEELQSSEFRARFEAKGPYTDYVRAIPTALITRAHPALLGAAIVAQSLA